MREHGVSIALCVFLHCDPCLASFGLIWENDVDDAFYLASAGNMGIVPGHQYFLV
jgi:hypothetical protein